MFQKDEKFMMSKKIGYFLAWIQVVISIVFEVVLYKLGMIPGKYLALVAAVLALLTLAVFFSQYRAKRQGLIGKAFCIVLTALFCVGSFYALKTTKTVKMMSNSETIKVDNVVVAVLAEDTAGTLEEVADYPFGVQYQFKGDEIRKAVNQIQEELQQGITVVEYQSIQEQIAALYEGEVQAVIYNEAYTELLEEEFEDIDIRLKTIDIKTMETQVTMSPQSQKIRTEEESFTVYISGIDVYGSIQKTSRSDVNILAVVNPATHQVLLVTTPRDYYVKFPGITGEGKDKLTHAGIYGVDASVSTLSALYNTEIDFYVRVNFTSLIKMVDSLGGIDVNSEYAFTTCDGTLSVSRGINHLNGEQALAFSRERKNLPGGDFQRGKNQQAVIAAMIEKAVSPAILLGANDILACISENVDTNMSMEQIQRLIKSQLEDTQPWSVKAMAAEGKGDSQSCYSMPGRNLYVTQPDYESVEEIKTAIERIKEGEILAVLATFSHL